MERTFIKYQKTFALILASLVLSSAILWPLSQARALVPVLDVAVVAELTALNAEVAAFNIREGIDDAIQNSMIASLHLKEVGPPPYPPAFIPIPTHPCDIISNPSLDGIAYCFGYIVLRTLTTSLINWLKTGGSTTLTGGPLFVQDFAEHFKRELDNAAGLFLEAYLDPQIFNFLCSPFRINLGNLLNTSIRNQPTFAQRARCTLSSVVSNIENFRVDFTQGGWPAWYALLEPENDWIMSYFLGIDEAAKKQTDAFLRSEYELSTTGGGFLPRKNCQRIGGSIGSFVTNCVITNPGELVAESARQVFQIDVDRLKVADEINEVIATAIDTLISWAITGGGSFDGITPPPPPPPPPLLFDYYLVASGNISVTRGTSGFNIITRVLLSGSPEPVAISASGLPAGASAGFTNNPCTVPCVSALTISTASSTPAGTFSITVTGSPLNRATNFGLIVSP